jgi:hypothetical protein
MRYITLNERIFIQNNEYLPFSVNDSSGLFDFPISHAGRFLEYWLETDMRGDVVRGGEENVGEEE